MSRQVLSLSEQLRRLSQG
ncbi:hypothetical protein [Klebsiella pneumoniae]